MKSVMAEGTKVKQMAKKQSDNEQNGVLFHRDIPKMPEGYYSGDKPNLNLREFVEANRNHDPTDSDRSHTQAIDRPSYGRKNTHVYNMHLYWSKKPHEAIDDYITHFTEEEDLVLDPMCGSGSTVYSSVTNGRNAIGIDLSPSATFITANCCLPKDIREVTAAYDLFVGKAFAEAQDYYLTTCSKCGGRAITESVVYSGVYRCNRCLEEVFLIDCPEEGEITCCPRCLRKGIRESIASRSAAYCGEQPHEVSYKCISDCGGRTYKRTKDDPDFRYDLARLTHNASVQPPYWYPTAELPEHTDAYRLKKTGARTAAELFSPTNLSVLSILFNYADHDFIRFVLSASMFMASRMVRASNSQILPGRYYVPPIRKDMNVLNTVAGKYKNYVKLQQGMAGASLGRFMTSTQTATDLSVLPSNSIDYIFTDPPYGDKFQYFELNFLWEAWLGFGAAWNEGEMIINRARALTEDRWRDLLEQVVRECFRVLKPGRWLSMCYHDTSEGTWALVQDVIYEAGFVPADVSVPTFIETNQKSFKQYTADIVTKRDLVMSFRKPVPGEVRADVAISGNEDETTFGEKVRAIIRDYLDAHPGVTKDRVYDEVVSRMVRAGQMEAHNFDELLNQVADEVREPVRENLLENKRPDLFGSHEMSRWYLKESEISAVDSAESAKEDVAARRIRDFISEWLIDNPGADGVHYSDIFEHYVYTVMDKPRRSLAEWLLDYFYKTDAGTYRLPESEEEERIKTDARASGTSRRIKHYIAHLQQGTPILDRDRPSDATLAEWIRHCKRSGLYEQGKLLYERGGLNLDNLSEETLVDVEEDYQVCARMLARNGGKAKKVKK
ncbi:MAG: DNA methyltransferase [Armatimonadetes bacterium]|nr:DNA methyltransferase [Armatimonadota bacterium]